MTIHIPDEVVEAAAKAAGLKPYSSTMKPDERKETLPEQLWDTYAAWNTPQSEGLPEGAGVVLDAAGEIVRLRNALSLAEERLAKAMAALETATLDPADAKILYDNLDKLYV